MKAAVGLLLAILLVACSHGPASLSVPPGPPHPSGAPQAVVRAAMRKMVTAGSVHMRIQEAYRLGANELDRGGVADLSIPEGNLGASERQLTLDTFDLGSGSLGQIQEIIEPNGVVFFRWSLAGGPRPWMKFDTRKMGAAFRAQFTTATRGHGDDPVGFLEILGGIEHVKELGREIIDGANTYHYRGSVDLRTVLSNLPSSYRSVAASIASLMQKLQHAGLPELVVHAWVGDDGFVRQMTYSYPLGALQNAPKDSTIDRTIQFSKVGHDLRISAPPPGRVRDLTGLVA